MYIIVGLGNPGAEYTGTRHNVGFAALEYFLRTEGLPEVHVSAQCAGMLSEGVVHNVDIAVLLPTTFMNNSGSALKKCMARGKSTLDNVIVVHDDIDLPFGQVRISYDRGAGGHNGIKSIVDVCGSQKFTRVRVGIAHKNLFGVVKRPAGDALSKFVLGMFTKHESAHMDELYANVARALRLIIEKGREAAMQEIN
jgi:PTH1 family peptidyl-tRNA hydrolase